MNRHILLIPSWYKTKEFPLYGSFFEEQARYLMSYGFKVGVLYPTFCNFSDFNKKNYSKSYNDNDIFTLEFRSRGVLPKVDRLNYHFFAKTGFQFFLEYCKRNGKPDILHAHSVFMGGILAQNISTKTGIPYVITEHLTDFVTGAMIHPYDFEISKGIFNRSSHNYVVSSAFQKDLSRVLNLDKKTFSVLPNVIPQAVLNPIHKPKAIDTFIFLSIAFLDERKNMSLLIKAFSIFEKKHPNSVLRIGGDGSYKSKLVELATELSVDDKVQFIGEVKRDQIVDEMCSAHVFLLASTYETFGVVLIEALSCGTPVVSTPCGGPSDIIDNNNGLISKDFEADSFFNCMESIYSNYDTYDSELIMLDCKARFGEQKVIGELALKYNEIINKV